MHIYVKSVVKSNALRKHYFGITLIQNYFNSRGIIIFPYDDKQVILLTSIGNNNP